MADNSDARIRQVHVRDGLMHVTRDNGDQETVPQLVAGQFESQTAWQQRAGRYETVPRR
jgi:hypothetical protein